ncbi:MAG: hypothetical protein ACQEQN_08780, partial [Thermodesulfobacteriota bacterium]
MHQKTSRKTGTKVERKVLCTTVGILLQYYDQNEDEDDYMENTEYSYSMVQVIARIMDNYNKRISMRKYGFVEQYMIQQGI